MASAATVIIAPKTTEILFCYFVSLSRMGDGWMYGLFVRAEKQRCCTPWPSTSGVHALKIDQRLGLAEPSPLLLAYTYLVDDLSNR